MSNGRDFDSEREQREWTPRRARCAPRCGQRLAAAGRRASASSRAHCARRNWTLSTDFAAQTAHARCAGAPRERGVEVCSARLVALLVLAGAAALRAYGGSLLDFSFSVPDSAAMGIQSVVGWSLAVAACVGISSVFAFAGKR
jgi:hypothetical protein